MSTLEKTIDILNKLPENQIEIIYSYAKFLNSQQTTSKMTESESVSDVLGNIVGIVQDSGKTIEQYRDERIMERYEITD